MTGDPTYDTALLVAFSIVACTVVAAFFLKTPYGRFASKRWGVALDPRLGWFLMELPATLSFLYFYFQGERRFETVPLIFLAVWLIHYGNRGFAFPATMRVPKGSKGSFSLAVVLIGWGVTSLHGYLNARFITELAPHLTDEWLTDPRFVGGLGLYYVGYLGTLHSEHVLRTLRTKDEVARGEKVYRIPQRGLFRWVTNAAYFTELVAWSGFAIATWSLGACFVLTISLANLVPRAFQTHRWYRETFPDYPRSRRVLIPFVL